MEIVRAYVLPLRGSHEHLCEKQWRDEPKAHLTSARRKELLISMSSSGGHGLLSDYRKPGLFSSPSLSLCSSMALTQR